MKPTLAFLTLWDLPLQELADVCASACCESYDSSLATEEEQRIPETWYGGISIMGRSVLTDLFLSYHILKEIDSSKTVLSISPDVRLTNELEIRKKLVEVCALSPTSIAYSWDS